MSRLCKIVPERCIACGLCALYAPEIFDYDDNGVVLFSQAPKACQQFIAVKDQENVIKAYKQCPVRAILLEK
ncbi:ferredoxin [Tetragenococcus halophilus]|uniref:ferredoxin n=1 Tax=Tetragenococcus halophilus TaxID=51669 RepID=UPI001F444A5A|nr:ferredoxin [Tetragenococcus halophilus]MCF1684977.1 ferredoxin [Tetragenococcus halophilus]